MKSLFFLFLTALLASSLYAQTLNVELERVDPVSSSWNWDIVTDGERIITVNQIGSLNIRENGVWQNIMMDPNIFTVEPRSVDIDNQGNIWIATEEHGLWRYEGNEEFTNFNTSNSTLPVDNLRVLDIFENFIWISTDGEGLIRYDMITGESDLFTESNSDLKGNFLDPFIDNNGTVWIENRECLTKITNDLVWSSEDFRSVVSGAIINDISFDNNGETWLAMNGGIVRSINCEHEVIVDDRLTDYCTYHKDTRGLEWYHSERLFTIKVSVRSGGQLYEFLEDSIEGIPSQVFELIEYKDTIMMVGPIGNNIAKFTFDFPSSVEEESLIPLKVFPNPATNRLYIENVNLDSDSQFIIRDLNGQEIQNGRLTQPFINTENIPTGVYLLQLNTPSFDKVLSQKFSIVK